MIEEVASAQLGGRTGAELSVWLESLFAAGKLVKIHGGDTTGWGPSVLAWISNKWAAISHIRIPVGEA